MTSNAPTPSRAAELRQRDAKRRGGRPTGALGISPLRATYNAVLSDDRAEAHDHTFPVNGGDYAPKHVR
jgi:hypothetical protein